MKIILHCSDSFFGNAAMLTQWHLQRGWRTIGYHYVILNGRLDEMVYHSHFNGWPETGRPLDDDEDLDVWERGAHVKGWNRKSIGVCLIGKTGAFTEMQIYTARWIVRMLKKQFFELSVWQHNDFDSKKYFCAGLTSAEIKFITGEEL